MTDTPKSNDGKTNDAKLMHLPIADQLATDIIDGPWPVGTSTTLEDIQRRFGVSRTVAREAARYLEATGAVTIRRRVGLVAQSPETWAALNPQVIHWKLHSNQRKQELLSLTELRLAVEPAAAACATHRASLETRAKMPVLALEMRRHGEAGDLDPFHELDIEFHSTLLRNSGNELFASLAPIVETILRGRVEINMYPSRPSASALDAHDEVADAVWKGDAERARKAMHDIVDEVSTVIAAR
ncbi:transcriptional regulator [Bifidobacterium primatium]|uniref:Transcriptional regulator n=2 Tax=Bifidobacterium TaxID=1678 RepID=A0A2M9HAD9_9BIFI|nr:MULTISPECIES: FCD domain-containing protein [Bifidobacterium]NEG96549.1 FCD domain-containing protein [Bifidobacterium sp. SMB2]NEH10534.1 FCD domain-containing protein [Bifidobacterium saimiriisciurei]NEH10683.1 FCD domain-containing protein [Bifidobacterium saimiriisciurei]PJM73783.1 transcriptional regulator [Bifidobacterium primatium]